MNEEKLLLACSERHIERFKALTLSFTTSRRNEDENNKRTNINNLIGIGKERICEWSYFWNSKIMMSILATCSRVLFMDNNYINAKETSSSFLEMVLSIIDENVGSNYTSIHY